MTIQINLANFTNIVDPLKIAEEIFRQNPHIHIPVPIREIAKAAGIKEIFSEKDIDFEGALLANEEKTSGVITYKEHTDCPGRERFTIAHELGHYLNPKYKQNFNCEAKQLSFTNHEKEKEANLFASYILMPDKFVLKHINSTPLLDLKFILEMAEKFSVSTEAIIHTVSRLSKIPIAFIFSIDNKVRYFSKSKNFPYLNLRPKQKMPTSILYSENENFEKQNIIRKKAISWPLPYSDKTLIEETVSSKGKYGITMLYYQY